MGWVNKQTLDWASQVSPRTTPQYQPSQSQEAGESGTMPPFQLLLRATLALPWSLTLPLSLRHSALSKTLYEPFCLAEPKAYNCITAAQRPGNEGFVVLFYLLYL